MMAFLVKGDATTTQMERALPLTSFLSNSWSEWSASQFNAVIKASPHQVCQEVEFRHSNDELFVKDHSQVHNVVYISP